MNGSDAIEKILHAMQRAVEAVNSPIESLYEAHDAAVEAIEWSRQELSGEDQLAVRTYFEAVRLAVQDALRAWPDETPQATVDRLHLLLAIGAEARQVIRDAQRRTDRN